MSPGQRSPKNKGQDLLGACGAVNVALSTMKPRPLVDFHQPGEVFQKDHKKRQASHRLRWGTTAVFQVALGSAKVIGATCNKQAYSRLGDGVV